MKKYLFFYSAALPVFLSVLAGMFLFFRLLGYSTSSFIPEFKKIIKIREYIVQNKMPDFPRIYVVSGSNSLFGIDAEVLERKLHYPVVNLGLHAGLPMEVYFHQLKRYAKPGDTVIMPWGFGYYKADAIMNSFTADFYFESEWDYFEELDWRQRIRFFCKYSREWGGKALGDFFSQRNRNYRRESSWKSVVRRWLRRQRTNTGYSASALDPSGCMLIDVSAPLPNWNKNQRQDPELFDQNNETRLDFYPWPPAGPKGDFEVGSSFVGRYKKFRDYCKKNGITLILTWPVIANYDHDFCCDLYWSLKRNDIDIVGNPLRFVFHENYFLDGPQHLNRRGAQVNSEMLADVVAPLLPDIQNEFTKELSRLSSSLKKEQSSIKTGPAQDCMIVGNEFFLGPGLIAGLFPGKMDFHPQVHSLSGKILLSSEFVIVPDNVRCLKKQEAPPILCSFTESLLNHQGIGKNFQSVGFFRTSRAFSLRLFKRVKTIPAKEVDALLAMQDAQ